MAQRGRSSELSIVGRGGSVYIFDQIRCVLGSSGTEVDAEHRLYSETFTPAEELICSDKVGFYLEPGQIKSRRPLFFGTYTVFPAVAGEEVSAGVTDMRELQRFYKVHYILAESEFICGRMIRFVDPGIYSSSHMLHEGTVNTVIYAGNSIVCADSYRCFHLYILLIKSSIYSICLIYKKRGDKVYFRAFFINAFF